MRKIDELIKFLDDRRGFGMDEKELKGIEVALKEARRLAAKEAEGKTKEKVCKECYGDGLVHNDNGELEICMECGGKNGKPEAPASLVDEIIDYIDILENEEENDIAEDLKNRIRRYRPVPDRIDELVKELEKARALAVYAIVGEVNCLVVKKETINEILAKFKGVK